MSAASDVVLPLHWRGDALDLDGPDFALPAATMDGVLVSAGMKDAGQRGTADWCIGSDLDGPRLN
jgi:hypothetical protein